jgi:hypothetical protein
MGVITNNEGALFLIREKGSFMEEGVCVLFVEV